MADSIGGAVYVTLGAQLVLQNALFQGNTALLSVRDPASYVSTLSADSRCVRLEQGGAVYVDASSSVLLNASSVLVSNSAPYGGAVRLTRQASMLDSGTLRSPSSYLLMLNDSEWTLVRLGVAKQLCCV